MYYSLIKVGVVKIIVNNFEYPKIMTKLKGYRDIGLIMQYNF